MLATDSTDPSVKNFSFLTDSISHRLKKNYFFDRIEPLAQDFFPSKDQRSNRGFFTVNRLWVWIPIDGFFAIGA